MTRYAMIMAGGSGTRLWPMSRKAAPKQLIPFIGGRSLLQIAAERIERLVPVSYQLICTGESFRAPIRAALPRFTDDQILGEPEPRDTVNAVGLTAAMLAARDPGAIFAVLTADHLISPEGRFRDTMDTGFRLVEQDPSRLVTFSIQPTYPATGYGYVERGEPIRGFEDCWRVARFVEKPDEPTARRYVESGRFGWNSGMFVFSAHGFLRALERFFPGSRSGLDEIARDWDTPRRIDTLRRVYPTLPKKSVDFAVMEPASTSADCPVCTVKMAVEWIDVGSWPSYGETLPADASGNRANTPTLHLGSSNVMAVSDDPSHTIATIGCRDLIVVHTQDVTLICPASEAQRVKDAANAAPPALQ